VSDAVPFYKKLGFSSLNPQMEMLPDALISMCKLLGP
jgi:hypothetical protein